MRCEIWMDINYFFIESILENRGSIFIFFPGTRSGFLSAAIKIKYFIQVIVNIDKFLAFSTNFQFVEYHEVVLDILSYIIVLVITVLTLKYVTRYKLHCFMLRCN